MVCDPEHVRHWWSDEAEFAAVPGSEGRIGFGNASDGITWERFTVVDAVPHRLFSFRWTHDEGQVAAADAVQVGAHQ